MAIPPSILKRRTRRTESVDLLPGFWGSLIERCLRTEVLSRLGLCFTAAIILLVMLHGWRSPFPYRLGAEFPHGIVARVPFERPDVDRTRQSQERAGNQVRNIYSQDKSPLIRVRDGLKNRAKQIADAEVLSKIIWDAWLEFAPESAPDSVTLLSPIESQSSEKIDSQSSRPTFVTESLQNDSPDVPKPASLSITSDVPSSDDDSESQGQQDAQSVHHAFQIFRSHLDTPDKLLEFEKAIDRTFSKIEQHGVLEKLQHGIDDGSQTEIDIHPLGDSLETTRVQVAEVLSGEAKIRLKGRLEEELGAGTFSDQIFAWIEPKLSGTLELNSLATAKARRDAIDKTPQQFIRYAVNDLLAPAGTPITLDELLVLRREHDEYVRQSDLSHRIGRCSALAGMFLAMFSVSGFYIHLHHRELLSDLGHVTSLLGLSVFTVVLCTLASGEAWHAEIVPLLLFAMTVAIAYDEDLALLFSAEVSLIVVIGLGQGIAEYITLLGAASACIFWLGRIRSRSKLIYVGLWAGAIVGFTQIGAGVLVEQPLDYQLLYDAGRTCIWTILSGFLMTGLLPFIERSFGVLTDLSLLEVGDIAHPLLQELVRRAPGTYNHSINVASIGEAAAESIGARGLLVRVGAYFHDIGKMLKPDYFVENQGQQGNRHESLAPAMSTLIIIAHVKEGAELARQYGLPAPIIDMISEHHGTTLVEFFYRRASEKQQADPTSAEIDEHAYRYPGPKPATRESAVLMLSDAVESASRSLVEPTPSRIAGLVHDLAMKRLLDGQFDDCGLTLQELEKIEQSLVKSLTAVYHGRVKYPDQRTA
ncbi:MAG: HDIG domain-containing metalloprotein [Planctomycetota bacterium]